MKKVMSSNKILKSNITFKWLKFILNGKEIIPSEVSTSFFIFSPRRYIKKCYSTLWGT